MRKLVVAALAAAGAVMPVLPLTTTVASATASGVRIVNLNILHGVFCERESDGCQAEDRVALLGQQLEESECPEVVGLQEINPQMTELINDLAKTVCDGAYKVVFKDQQNGVDAERVLTTLKVKSTKVIKLSGNFRTASRVVLKSEDGPLVLVVTHQDGDPDEPFVGECRTCRPPCTAQDSPFDCQTIAAADLADSVGGSKAIRVLMGDFNVGPTSERYLRLISEGWIDSYVAAGNAECVAATGVGCTSGRDDQTIAALKDPAAKESVRIDFVFVKPPGGCEIGFDPFEDADGDGLGTGLFFAAPTVDGPGGIVWVSDHTGVSADFTCAPGD